MKKGINFWSFANGTTVREALTLAKAAGFDGIELALGEIGLVGMDTPDAGKEAKKMAGDMGLELPSLACGSCWDYLLTSCDAGIRNKAKDLIRRQADMAAEIGADTILILAGAVGVDFLPNKGGDLLPYDEAYDVSLVALRELTSYAESLRITLAIENVWNKFLLSPIEFRDFIDKINSEYVGCYFDVGNVVLTGYPEQWVKILGKRIKKVHFKDYRREPGGFNCFVDLLSGDVNYPAVVEALENVGYDDYCIAEMIPNYKHYNDQTIYNASMSMDRILKKK